MERNLSFSRWSNLWPWHYIILILVAVALATTIAVKTHYRAHPDEYYHVDAFRYFEDNWWPPDLGSDEVIYSPQGWSRVYTGEIVYIVYGKLGQIIERVWHLGNRDYLVYRLLNAGLFLATLTALFFSRCEFVNPVLLAITFICIPQVHYIYAYANSDAWGLSMSVFLFLLAAAMSEKSMQAWSWGEFGTLGALTGLLLVSKKPYLLALVLPYALLARRAIQAVRQGDVSVPQMLAKAIVLGALVVAVAAPLRVIYPLSQGDFDQAVERMREAKAADEFKPSNATYETYRLAAKGETYYDMLAKRHWIELSLKSFYGLFGYMNVRNPAWIYNAAGFGALLGFCLTAFSTVKHWRNLHHDLRVSLILSLLILLVNTGTSIYRSLHVGFQPQGRYLFASLIPVALMQTGTAHAEGVNLKTVRIATFAVMYAICIYSLIFVVATNPALG